MSKKKRTQRQQPQKNHFSLRNVSALTPTQEDAFHGWYNDYNLLLHGVAGTGKTFISLFLALQEILEERSDYKQVIIVRSGVPSRDMGFLPGRIDEKANVYEDPYQEICDDLFGRGDGYEILKKQGIVKFLTTSYLRGLTFDNSIVVVDECQNMTLHELDTIMTRMGENSRIMFCGDFRQTDLTKDKEKAGLHTFMKILDETRLFEKVEFGVEDIVRSGLVKQYIISKLELGFS